MTARAVFNPFAIMMCWPHHLDLESRSPYMGSLRATICMSLSIYWPHAPATHVSTSYHVAVPKKADRLLNVWDEFTMTAPCTSVGSRYAATAEMTAQPASSARIANIRRPTGVTGRGPLVHLSWGTKAARHTIAKKDLCMPTESANV